MAAIDLNTVRATIEARVATELASSPAIAVVFHNMSFARASRKVSISSDCVSVTLKDKL